MNENQYLELCNQLKEINESRDKEMKKIINESVEIKKKLITCYGLVRLVSNLIHSSEIDAEPYILLDVLRGMLSEFIEEDILKVKNEEEEI